MLDETQNILKETSEPSISFKGYFQSDFHFKDCRNDIRFLFTPPEGINQFLTKNSEVVLRKFPELLETSDEKCFLGVRRGDYVTYSWCHNPCGMTFYNDAIRKIKEDVPSIKTFYIMSDDLEWCRRNFVGEEYKFIDAENDIINLFTIALFKNFVMSNSTFYWWGSYLSIYGDDTKIIAPDKWNNESNYQTIYRDGMEIIVRPIETE
jgi:hypothetical protein